MDRKDIVVIGASAGGMEALERLVGSLPADLAASLFVVWHLPPGAQTILPLVLSRAGPLPAALPQDGDPIVPGRIYVAPNDHHLLLERGCVRVTKGPKENRFRPAIDPLFRSAAYVYGPRVIGVVLSGALDDGTAGLWTIKQRGGTAVVQDPADALHRSMPLNALAYTEADYRMSAAAIGALLGRLTREQAATAPALPAEEQERTQAEIRIAEGAEAMPATLAEMDTLTPFTCPDCNGVLMRVREGSLARFRCHTGHAFSSGVLLGGASEMVEKKLWEAVRALDETVLLLNERGEQFARGGDTHAAEECFQKAREAHERAEPIRQAAMGSEALTVSSSREEQGRGE